MNSSERIFVSAVVKYIRDCREHRITRCKMGKYSFELEEWGRKLLDESETKLKEKK